MSNSEHHSVLRGLRAQTSRAFHFWCLFILFLVPAIGTGQREKLVGSAATKPDSNALDLYQSLLGLQNPWTVMCVAAHPDDEDGATLTILRRKQGVHTVTVFSTFGEGGQNAVGPELYEELGAIRARETLEASKIQGSAPYFLGLRDFGFSKAAEEAFRVWGHDEALRRLVLKIRELRPDVIITNHDTVSGHGHHQATGRLVLEAFDAAADRRRFPEQLRGGVGTWQVLRLFVRFQFQSEAASKAAEEEATRTGKIVSFDPNERDPMRGTTYAEQALQALQRHATQGPWPKTLPAGGRPIVRYRLVRSAGGDQPLPSNARSVLDGLQVPRSVSEKILPLVAQANLQSSIAESRSRILDALVASRKAGYIASIWGARDVRRLQLSEAGLNDALAKASAIEMKLVPRNHVLIPGATTNVSLTVSNNGERDARMQSLRVVGLLRPAKLWFPQTLRPGSTITVELLNFTPRGAAVTVPAAEHLYDGKLFGEQISATGDFEVDGARFPVTATKLIDIAPPVQITSISPAPIVLTSSPVAGESSVTLRITNNQRTSFKGRVMYRGDDVGHDRQLGPALMLAPGETRDVSGAFRYVSHTVTESGRVRSQRSTVPFSITDDVYNRSRSNPPISLRTVDIVYVEATTARNLRVGYVRSFDETLRNSLAALGVEAKELTVDDVRRSDLNSYHAIILDNRGYQAHPELVAVNSRLLDYAREGGTLIVFYHRTNEWNPDPKVSRPQLAPYPINLGSSRVTNENAPIEFTDPGHGLLNYPNKITQADFVDWIQERGLYFPETWDSHYSAPFATNDAGEKSLRGGLLAADYGRGRYIYTSMVWYRQLRAGVPGAYRMLANMISYGRETR